MENLLWRKTTAILPRFSQDWDWQFFYISTSRTRSTTCSGMSPNQAVFKAFSLILFLELTKSLSSCSICLTGISNPNRSWVFLGRWRPWPLIQRFRCEKILRWTKQNGRCQWQLARWCHWCHWYHSTCLVNWSLHFTVEYVWVPNLWSYKSETMEIRNPTPPGECCLLHHSNWKWQGPLL